MQKYSGAAILAVILAVAGCATVSEAPTRRTDVEPPTAKKVDHAIPAPGGERIDEYYWLNQREDPEVIAYLNAENDYTSAMTEHLDTLKHDLFEEIKGRIKQDDSTVPNKDRNFWYYRKFEEGNEYPIFCRKRGNLEAPEEIVLDVNQMAGDGYFQVAGFDLSQNEQIAAYPVDDVGRRIYTVRFKNLETGQTLDEEIPGTSGNVVWANDNQTVFYTKRDPVTLRSFQIYKHRMGTDPAEDPLVYEETDETFSTFIFKTKSRAYLMIGSSQTLSTEYRVLKADNPGGTFRVIHPRERNLEYFVDHLGDNFYIRTNLDAKNFRLMKAPVSKPGKKNWTEVIPHRVDVLLEGFELFRSRLALQERSAGLNQIRVMNWDGSDDHYLKFGEPAYLASISTNTDMDSTTLRYAYESLTTPESVFDYDMASHTATLIDEQEVLGGFDKNDYSSERIFVEARDGAQVPVSIVYRKGTRKDGSAPLLLYGYGSYGNSIDASFNSTLFSLIDRGFIYAIAHIRGGEEMGRSWYEDGKLLKKKNTFQDFIDVGRSLIDRNFTSSEKIFAYGGSAGGLLIGAVINMDPELFEGVVAAVPFVDVVTTMLDDTIPLTTFEYDEWGNPNDKVYYDYMLSYSPYDNVESKTYPNILVTTGLHDSQVQYFEPAKWVARLRDRKQGDNLLLLKTNMVAGHGGASGRYKRYEETAFRFAFLLDLARGDS